MFPQLSARGDAGGLAAHFDAMREIRQEHQKEPGRELGGDSANESEWERGERKCIGSLEDGR